MHDALGLFLAASACAIGHPNPAPFDRYGGPGNPLPCPGARWTGPVATYDLAQGPHTLEAMVAAEPGERLVAVTHRTGFSPAPVEAVLESLDGDRWSPVANPTCWSSDTGNNGELGEETLALFRQRRRRRRSSRSGRAPRRPRDPPRRARAADCPRAGPAASVSVRLRRSRRPLQPGRRPGARRAGGLCCGPAYPQPASFIAAAGPVHALLFSRGGQRLSVVGRQRPATGGKPGGAPELRPARRRGAARPAG